MCLCVGGQVHIDVLMFVRRQDVLACEFVVPVWCVQELEDILVHLRLMQISSTFFAQEVEPTGLLTVQQTLDR